MQLPLERLAIAILGHYRGGGCHVSCVLRQRLASLFPYGRTGMFGPPRR